MVKVLIILLIFSVTASAQELADKISYITVGTNITLDTIHSFRAEDKKQAFIKQGIRDGIIIAVSEILKRAIHKTRPDGSDNKSFPSEHSAFSCVSIDLKSKRVAFEAPIAFGTLIGRTKANKHDWIDVLTGCGIGIATGFIR